MQNKCLDALTVIDILQTPIWRFTNRSSVDELEIKPVLNRPCIDLSGAIVGTTIVFADGSKCWALLQNIEASSAKMNDHFLTVTIDNCGQWFSLARYHDIGLDEFGPLELAKVIGKTIDDIFPIEFDIRKEVGFSDEGLFGTILKEPRSPLTRREIIELAVRPVK